MADYEEDDDAARKRARGSMERVPGIPNRRLPPIPMVAPELESTPPEPIVARQRSREQTRVGGFHPSSGSAPAPPSRDRYAVLPEKTKSLSPSPESGGSLKVITPDGSELKFKKHHLRQLWVWVAPVVVTIATSAYGYVKAYAVGFAKGYRDASTEMAELRGKVNSLASAVTSATAEVQQTLVVLQASVNRDGVLYNDHDRRVLTLEKQVETMGNRLDALAKTKAIIVKPSSP